MTSTGHFPTAVSPVTITAAAPSATALKISLTSARVGTGFCSMDASICVTTMNGFPALRHWASIRFWAAGSSHRGMAFPRSPLAMTISSAFSRNSGSRSSPIWFSILANSRIFAPPFSSSACRTVSRSRRLRTKGCITPVTPQNAAMRIFSTSDAVIVGGSRSAPGRARLFRPRRTPPRRTSATAPVSVCSVTRSSSLPSSKSTSCPGNSAGIAISGKGIPLPPNSSTSPSFSVIGSANTPTRSSGPCISMSSSACFPQRCAALCSAST